MSSEKIKELDNRIAIIKASIYGVFFSSNDPKNISFNIVLNRVLILIQKPITFVIYKKNENGSYYRYFNFVKDGWHKNDFLEKLDAFEKAEDFQIKLFDTYSEKYKLAVFEVHRNESNKKQKSEFKHIENNCVIEEISNNLSSEEDYIKYIMIKIFSKKCNKYSKKFIDATERSISSIHQDKDKNDSDSFELQYKNEKEDFLKYERLSFDADFLLEKKEKFKKEIDENIEKVFIKIKESTKMINSLCLDSKGDEDTIGEESPALANVLFFIRDYSNICFKDNLLTFKKRRKEEDKKFDGYDYNLRICLPESQRKEIKSYFSKLNKDDVLPFYNDGDDDKHKTLDEWFWNNLKEENFLDQIIDIISSNVGDYARSITDPCFQNGLVHFRLPFEKGGLDRAGIPPIKDNNLIEKQFENDARRIVITYYLYQGMNKNKKIPSRNFTIVTIPIELNGRVFGVTTHSIENRYSSSDIFNSNDVWQSIYYLYNDIGSRIERNVRKYLKSSFSSVIIRDFFSYLEDLTIKSIREGITTIDFGEILDYGNRNSHILSLFNPYDFIEFRSDNQENREQKISVLLGYKDVFFYIKENKFFYKYREDRIGKIDFDDFNSFLVKENANTDSSIRILLDEINNKL